MTVEVKDNKVEFNTNIDMSPVKFEAIAKADLTESANMVTKDLIESKNKMTKSIGEKIGFCWDFLTAKIRPIMYEIVKESEYKLKQIDIKLEKKYNNIPDENKTDPRLSIIGPAIDVLKYNLDEEHIKEMFINILANEMDNRKQNKVLPAYTEIIKQLSKDDAQHLKYLKNINKDYLSICYIRLRHKDKEGYTPIKTIIVDNISNIATLVLEPEKIILDNLERLQLIKIHELNIIPGDKLAIEKAYNSWAKEQKIDNNPNIEYFYEGGLLEITDFGKQFIDICCS